MKKQMQCSIPLRPAFLAKYDRADMELITKAIVGHMAVLEDPTENTSGQKITLGGLQLWETVRLSKTEPSMTYLEIMATFEDDEPWKAPGLIDDSQREISWPWPKWLTFMQCKVLDLLFSITNDLISEKMTVSIVEIPNTGTFYLEKNIVEFVVPC